jgi:gliding motility-associated-like protein
VEYSVGTGYQAGATFSGLAPGTYTLSVRSIADNTCITFAAATVTINAIPAAPTVPTVASTTQPTCAVPTGTIDFTPQAGVEYSVGTGYQAGPTFAGLAPGTYTLSVRNIADNTCVTLAAVTVTINAVPAAPAIPTVASTIQPTCAVPTGTIDFTPQAGVEYSVGTGYQAGATFAGLAPNVYTLSVRNTVDNTCETFAASTVTIDPVPAVPAVPTASVTIQPTCSVPTGTIVITAPIGAAYEYSVDGLTYQAGVTFAGIVPGNYTLTSRLAASPTCISATAAAITVNAVPAPPTVTSANTDILCKGASTGAIDITAAGGTAPYSYAWTGTGVVAGAEDQVGLAAGAYTVVVTDAGGCVSVPYVVTLTEPAIPVSGSIITQSNVTTFGGNNGSVEVAGSGGTGPYTYSLNAGPFQPSGIFGTLTAGTYVVTVRDNILCTFDVSVTITQPSATLTGSIVTQTNVTCFGTPTGSVTVTGVGGLAPYEYRMGAGTWQPSGTFSSLNAGSYTITVRDAALLTFDIPVNITGPAAALAGTITAQTNVLCYGSSTGAVTVSGNGGIGPYQYKIDAGSFQASGSFTGLVAGTHTVVVQDSKLCTFSMNVIITEPATALAGMVTSTNVTCFGAANGTATVSASGGTTPYQYSLDNGAFQASAALTGLTPGNHTIVIRDAGMCTKSLTVTITEPSALSATSSTTEAQCPGEPNGSINVTVSGGTQPYSVIWSDGNVSVNRLGVANGDYTAVITDLNGCAIPVSVTVGVVGTEDCIHIPQILTPNNDGYNDTWRIENIDLFPNAEVVVFSRWGKKVYESRNVSANPWDGRLNGKLLPTDSYHYILDLHNGSVPKSGVISIIK